MSNPIDRDDEFPSPISPYKLKSSEVGRINPAYSDVADINSETLAPGVTYIWTLNQTGRLLIGLEKPWEHPEAFHIDTTTEEGLSQWAEIVKQLKQSSVESESHEGYGHPTLGASFTESGDVEVGEVFLGGELRFDDDKGFWVLNNRSGRYGRARETAPEAILQIQQTLEHVAKRFQAQGILVEPKLFRKEIEGVEKFKKRNSEGMGIDRELDREVPIVPEVKS